MRLAASRRTDRGTPRARALTRDQSLALLQDAGFSRKRYFELLRDRTGLTSVPRNQPEADVAPRDRSCFRQGLTYVFGDSIARDVASRLALLRGGSLRRRSAVDRPSAPCASANDRDVYWESINLLPSSSEPLPHTELPCAPGWVWYGMGLHHLYTDGRALVEGKCGIRDSDEGGGGAAAGGGGGGGGSGGGGRSGGYFERMRTPLRLRSANGMVRKDTAEGLHASFPLCWQAFAARVLAARAPRTRVVLLSLLPPEPLMLLARPPKADWPLFLDLSLAHMWLAEQRRMSRALLARAPRAAFADVGVLAEEWHGVRCDGMHFGSAYGAHRPEGACNHSAAAYDRAIVAAARRACRSLA